MGCHFVRSSAVCATSNVQHCWSLWISLPNPTCQCMSSNCQQCHCNVFQIVLYITIHGHFYCLWESYSFIKFIHLNASQMFNGVKMYNFHVLSIPSNLLYHLCGVLWKAKIIGVAPDRVANMTGHLTGAVTLIVRLCYWDVCKIWSGAHQLYFDVQELFDDYINESFEDPYHRLTSYLRRQTNLISFMVSRCPTVATIRWPEIAHNFSKHCSVSQILPDHTCKVPFTNVTLRSFMTPGNSLEIILLP